MYTQGGMRSLISSIAFLLISSVLWGQGYLFNTQKPVYSIDSIEFRFLCTDPDGLIYIGTDKGLLFYNGNEAERIIEGNFTSGYHTGNEIMLGNEEGVLLTAKGEGLNIKSWQPVADSSAISDILVKGNQIITATKGEGILLTNRSDSKRANTENGLLNDNYVYQVEVFNDDIWVATDRGVDCFWNTLEKKAHYSNSGLTKSMAQAPNGIIFAGYSSGLSVFSADSGKVHAMKQRNGIDKIIAIEDELFALEKGSLSYLDNDFWKSVGKRSDIVDMISTRHNNLVTLHANGDIGFADLSFLEFNTELSGESTALYHSENRIFIASKGSVFGIDIHTGEQMNIVELGSDVVIVDLLVLENKLYCGTFNRGLLEVDLRTGQKSSVEGLPDQSVLSLAKNEDGRLWISTLSGLSQYILGHSAESVDLGSEFPSTYIYKLFSHNGDIWLGTDGNGVFKYKEGEIEKIPTKGQPAKNSVYDITSDNEGHIYAISLEHGVLKFNEKRSIFDSKGIFQSQDYSSFGISGQGDYLICTDSELYLARGNLTRRYPETYFPHNLSGAYMHTFSDNANPWLYFASGAGVYAYRNRKNTFETPSVILSKWEVNYVRQSLDETRLSSGQDNHVFKFATSSYRAPENQQIEVRLNGYDRDFRKVTSREVNYPKLPPGNYVLEARLSENGLVYPETVKLLSFKIAIPLYFQWWFVLLCVLVLAALGYLIIKVRINRLNQARLAEQKLLESELSLLRNQVNPHFLFNSFNTLMNLIEQAPREANEYLQRLSDFYRRMLEKHEDQVVTLEEELILAREYCYLQKRRFGEAFNFTENSDEEVKRTKIPVLTMQLLIENAIKHNVISRTRPLEIILENQKDYLCIKNKIAAKREPAEGTGMGLENIRKRYSSIFQKDIKVERNDGWFEVYLPIVN